jgi:hypothetical protein
VLMPRLPRSVDPRPREISLVALMALLIEHLQIHRLESAGAYLDRVAGVARRLAISPREAPRGLGQGPRSGGLHEVNGFTLMGAWDPRDRTARSAP